VLLYFFFSSRRRHTRFSRDWSSDVCSSDLHPTRISLAFHTSSGTVDISSSLSGGSVGGLLDARRELIDPARNELGRIAVGIAERSEERRVGKEGRAGGAQLGHQ